MNQSLFQLKYDCGRHIVKSHCSHNLHMRSTYNHHFTQFKGLSNTHKVLLICQRHCQLLMRSVGLLHMQLKNYNFCFFIE